MDGDDLDQKIRAVVEGKTESYREVVLLTQDRLRAYLLHYCPWPDTIDDVAQETYLYAYEHLKDYSPGTNFLAWLRTLAKHRVQILTRKLANQARRDRRYGDALLAEQLAQAAEPDPGSDRIEALRGCLGKLGDRPREIITRRYSLGQTTHQIAEALQMARNHVLVLLFRIRERLRLCVQGQLPEAGGSS